MAELKIVNYRGVMIVGKTGVGKSTVANAIIGDDRFLVSNSLCSVTSIVDHCDAEVTDCDVLYRLKIMDTVGFFDTGPRTNSEVISKIKEYLNTHFQQGINLIIFVIREGRFTPEEKDCFDFIRTTFKNEISEISALVITNCDIKSEEDRSKIVEEYRTNSLTKDIAEFMKVGIYTVGFPQRRDYSSLPIPVRDFYEQSIAKDRMMLWKVIKKSSRAKVYRQLYNPSFWELCTIV